MAAALPAPAMASRMVGSKADYFDSQRQRQPNTILANEYIAFKSSYQKLVDGAKYLQVPCVYGAGADYNQLFFWSPAFSPSEFLTETFHNAAIACYEEFRVRCVKVTLHAPTADTTGYHSDPSWKVPSWIYYPDNHYQLNPANEIGTYSDMLESGERIKPCGHNYDDNLVMRAVPQILSDMSSLIQVAGNVRDIQAPWMKTSAANLSGTFYMPYFVWRQRYSDAAGLTASYQVTMQAIIEFRNPRSSQL